MFVVITITLGIDKNIVDEHHDESVQILHKHLIYQIHEISWCIGQSK